LSKSALDFSKATIPLVGSQVEFDVKQGAKDFQAASVVIV
jgi:cold shock CspA family protein